MTAKYGAAEAEMPSITAELRPRRPIRWMQRTLACRRASSLTTAAVPSGELSSTTMNSKGMSPSALVTRSNSDTTLSRSLKVGTMTASCGELQICCTGVVFGSSSMVTTSSKSMWVPTTTPPLDAAIHPAHKLQAEWFVPPPFMNFTQPARLDSILPPSYIPCQLLALSILEC